LKNNFPHAFPVAPLVILALNFVEVAELPEVIEMKKSEEDTEAVFYFQVNNNHGERSGDEREPAYKRITISKAGDGEAGHEHGKKSEQFFSYGYFALAHVAYAGLVLQIRIHDHS
jgi:hypothetical protein